MVVAVTTDCTILVGEYVYFCLYVCLSVRLSLRLSVACVDIKRSKVKVTRTFNAHTVNAQYLPNRKAYELQTWYADGARSPSSSTNAVSSKVKGQGHKVNSCV